MKNKFFNLLVVVLFLGLFSCEEEYVKPVKISYQQQAIDSTLAKNTDMEEFIKPYREKIDAEMKTVLSYSPKSMFKSDSPYNTAIGNMMADAVLEEANPLFKQRHNLAIDAVLLNYGGIRSGISEGEITVRTAYDIMPFENKVVVVELPYEAAQEMIKYLMKKRTAHPISGMQIQLNHNYSFKEAFINNEAIHPEDNKNKSFYIATSDYLLQGGDEMDFFTNNTEVFHLDYKLRNLFIDYFKKKDEINPTQDNRFTVGN
ncbi:5'-nucleotidase C-terminal domain-containing protein [Psychroflexus planctonicus]|nr:5'-nucleotidase [Psychroflexus planctonicus]